MTSLSDELSRLGTDTARHGIRPSTGGAIAPRRSADPIVGWRTWYVDREGDTLLRSPSFPVFLWPARHRAEAACLGSERRAQSDHYAPDVDCTCGLHASREAPPDAVSGSLSVLTVTGQVSLWGLVIPHEHGWRAEYAYPYGLHVHPGIAGVEEAQRIARVLSSVYGVEASVR